MTLKNFNFALANYIDVKEFIEKNNLSVVADVAPATPQATAPPTAQAQVAQPPQASASPTRTVIQSQDHEIDYEDIELSNMRKIIAKRLVLSKTTIPHSYAKSSCPIDKIIALRKEMIKNNQKVSINDFIIKALALALKLVPELNSNYEETTGSFKALSTVDVSIAVATDKGLITPIVKNADRLSVLDISENVKVSWFYYKLKKDKKPKNSIF